MPRVFVVEKTERFDLTSAEDYGTLVFLSEHTLNPFDSASTLERVINALEQHQYDPQVDFICITGNPATIALASMALFCVTDKAQLLLFDARTSAYKLRVVQDPMEARTKEGQ